MKSVVATLATTLLILSACSQSPNLQELQEQLQQLKQKNQVLTELLTQCNTTTATAPVKPATAISAAQTTTAAGNSDQQSLTWRRSG
jgi:Tfp pilus assembly protein PilP